jgi:hypothetical protein
MISPWFSVFCLAFSLFKNFPNTATVELSQSVFMDIHPGSSEGWLTHPWEGQYQLLMDSSCILCRNCPPSHPSLFPPKGQITKRAKWPEPLLLFESLGMNHPSFRFLYDCSLNCNHAAGKSIQTTLSPSPLSRSLSKSIPNKPTNRLCIYCQRTQSHTIIIIFI